MYAHGQMIGKTNNLKYLWYYDTISGWVGCRQRPHDLAKCSWKVTCLVIFISLWDLQQPDNKPFESVTKLNIQNRAHLMKYSSTSTQMVFKKLIKKVGPVFGHQQMLLKQDKPC